MKATTLHEPRDSSGSSTARLVSALLAGNVFATVCVAAFRPFPGNNAVLVDDGPMSMMLTSGTMSLVSCALLFLLSALRRGERPWWTMLTAANLIQIARLGPAVAVIGMWNRGGMLAGMLWGFAVVPLFALLAAVGLIVTMRELRRSKRRRLSRAA